MKIKLFYLVIYLFIYLCVCLFQSSMIKPKMKKSWAYNHIPIPFVTNDFMSTDGQYHARRQQHNKRKVPRTSYSWMTTFMIHMTRISFPTSKYRGGCSSTIVPLLASHRAIIFAPCASVVPEKKLFLPMCFGRVRKKL